MVETNRRWSICAEEDGRFFGDWPTKDAAVAAAPSELDLTPGCVFWVGECQNAPAIPAVPDASGLIDQAVCDASDNYGECSEDWLSHVSKEAEADLQKRLSEVWRAWIVEHHLEADFFVLPLVEEFRFPPEPAKGDR